MPYLPAPITLSTASVLPLCVLLAVGFACDSSRLLDEEERDLRLRDLLAIGAAHADIDEWQEARESFESAAAVSPAEPAVGFNLALAQLRLGELEAAAESLQRIDPNTQESFRARVELLRSSLAVENGDFDEQAARLLHASELDPQEAAYPYALSQVSHRLNDQQAIAERGRWLERAFELWPQNSRLAAELAQWSLDHSSTEVRSRGVQLLQGLAADSGLSRVQQLVARGLQQLTAATGARAPVALRHALNLLRPGKRFQVDSASLEARLEPRAFAVPVRGAPRQMEIRSSIALTPSSLLPPLPMAEGEEILQLVALADAVPEWKLRDRAVTLAALSTEGLYVLAREDREFRRIAPVQRGSQLLAGELDGDGLMELVVLGLSGVAVWGRSQGGAWAPLALDPALAAERSLSAALLIDFEHDGDLDLLAAGPEGLVLVTHRGEAGWGPPGRAPLPATLGVRHLASADLDGDNDQDLVLITETELRTFHNWRQGEYTAAESELLAAPASGLLTLDYDANGAFDVAVFGDGGVELWRNLGDGRLERDPEAAAEVMTTLTGGVRSLVAADLDLDGDLDLMAALQPENGLGIAVLQNVGGRFLTEPLASSDPQTASGLLALDLDGDRAPDLVTWERSGLATLASSGADDRHWLHLGLRGLPGKVPLDARGVQVLVAAQGVERWYQPQLPELTLGLGDRTPAVIRVTWPNGISEYLFEPAANRRHVVEQVLRIEGSCPFLYASDGSRMRFVTDILGLSPLGMLAAPGVYVDADPEEYLRLPDWVAWERGQVELRISEELREVAYLDQVELVVVDAPQEIAVYNGERWVEPPVAGMDLRLLASLSRPAAAWDDAGRDVLDVVVDRDQRYLTNHRGHRLYQGAVEPHRLILELPPELAAAEHPALLLEGWLHWANTSVNLARGQDPHGAPLFPYLEVGDGTGDWRAVPVAVGLPAGKNKPFVVDLSGVVDADARHLRLTTDFEVYWDRIAVADSRPLDSTPHRVHRLAPRSAELAYVGFSRWYREAANGPYVFDHSTRRPYPWRPDGTGGERVLAWQEHEGYYTAFGDVTEQVTATDDRLVVFGSGEELALSFDTSSLPPLTAGWRRTLLLHSEGWEKDGDPNVACSQTVGPLPFRGMEQYPCAGVEATMADSPAPDGSRTRWVSRDRLLQRAALQAQASPR